MEDNEILKENVRLRLANLNTTLAKVADNNGMSRARVALWVNGNPTLATLGHLAEILTIPTFELINPDFDPRKYPDPNEELNEGETEAEKMEDIEGIEEIGEIDDIDEIEEMA